MYNNLEDSLRHYGEWKKSSLKGYIYTVWFHMYNMIEIKL